MYKLDSLMCLNLISKDILLVSVESYFVVVQVRVDPTITMHCNFSWVFYQEFKSSN